MTRARELSRLVTPTNFTVDAANARVGVGSTTPASKLDVEGTLTADVVSVGGSVTAATFFGNGEGLTNVGFDTSQISANSISVTGVVTATTFSGNATGLSGTPNIVVGLATVGTALSLADDIKARFGTGGDLEIFHTGGHGFIRNTTGQLSIRDDSEVNITDLSAGYIFKGTAGESVELYYNTSKKFETAPTGAVVTGILTATTFKGDGSQLDGVGGDTDITSSLFT